MLAMIGDAISDPLVGIVSDRWRSRLGRRHPTLIAAPVPLALSLYFIFNPPQWILDMPGEMAIFRLACDLDHRQSHRTNVVQRPTLGIGGRAFKRPARTVATVQCQHHLVPFLAPALAS